MYFRPGSGTRRILGLVLLAAGASVIYLALPGWVWLFALGGSLLALGWALLREGKRL